MSLQVRNQTSGALERVAGFNDTDSILSPSSKNPISNKAVYNALLQKIDKTVTDLINYYDKSQVYTKPEVRALIGSINTLTIEVVAQLPTSEISTTTIYFVGPAAGTNNYDEYVYVGGNWVQIGDTTIDLSNYVTNANLTTVLQDYYTKSQADALFNDYYDKDAVDDLLDIKQNTLDFDNTPIAGSQNPVTSAGIKTALDNILISGNGGSIIKVHHTAGAAAAGNTVTASKGSYSVSSTFDVSGNAIIIGFGEIGEVTITATNGSESGSKVIEIPCFSSYSTTVGYGLDYKSWLIAGGMNPSSYSSLDEVLADEEAVRRLMTIHASVNYLATLNVATDEMLETVINNNVCAKWINLRDYALDTLYANQYIAPIMDAANKYFYGEWALMPQVPKMISNTQPLGNVTVSGTYSSSYPGWQVFDNNSSTYWVSTGKTNQWIAYEFPNAICVNQITIGCSVNGSDLLIKNFKVQCSNDGSTYTDVYTGLFPNNNGIYHFNFEDNTTSGKYWRLFIIDEYGTQYNIQLHTVQFYAWQPKGNIPIMTGMTSPYGTVSVSSTHPSASSTNLFYGWNAFDGIITDSASPDGHYWHSAMPSSWQEQWIQYNSVKPICVKQISFITTYSSAYIPYTYQILGSNDGTNFTLLGTFNFPDGILQSTKYTVNINNNNYYSYYRYLFKSKPLSVHNGCLLDEFQIYGRELETSVPIMSGYTVPFGECIYSPSAVYSGTAHAWHVFNGVSTVNTADYVWATVDYPGDCWVGYDFKKKVVVKHVNIWAYNSTGCFKNYKIQASNDGADWTTLFEETNTITTFGTLLPKPINNSTPYRMYRMYIVDNYGNPYTGCPELQFYGLDYSEYDWDTENPRHYIYDHGLDLEEFQVVVTQGNASVDKEPSQYVGHVVTGGTNTYLLISNNKINLVNYNRLIEKSGSKIYRSDSATQNGSFGIFSAKVYTYTDGSKLVSSTSFFKSNTDTVYCLNISNINAEHYVAIAFDSTSGANTNCSVTEAWLE